MLPDDIVEIEDLITLALKNKDHCVEWQKFMPPSSPTTFPTKIAALGKKHFEAMKALATNGAKQALDDVSVASADRKFCLEGHPYTPNVCSCSDVKPYISQVWLDMKDSVLIFQELPIMTNEKGRLAFKKCMGVDFVFVSESIKEAVKLMQDFGGHWTIDGSFQAKDGEFKRRDFQGCETNHWAEAVSSAVCARAFVKMMNYLTSAKSLNRDDSLKRLVERLLQTLSDWQTKAGLPCPTGSRKTREHVPFPTGSSATS